MIYFNILFVVTCWVFILYLRRFNTELRHYIQSEDNALDSLRKANEIIESQSESRKNILLYCLRLIKYEYIRREDYKKIPEIDKCINDLESQETDI